MNSAQAYVFQIRQPSKLAVGAIAHRTQKYRPTSVRYLSRSDYQPPQTERLAKNSIDTPQPVALHPPSKSSPSKTDLASDLSPAAWNNLGVALANLEQYDEALNAFEQALKLDPTFDRAECNARRIHDRSGYR